MMLLVIMMMVMMVRRVEEIKSKDIHQRFKLAADDDYDVGDDGDEGGIEDCDSNK